MRAVVITEHGGPEVLEVRNVDEPAAEPGRIVVEVAAAGVNYRDVYERRGLGAYMAPTPIPAGVEGAGTVREVGTGVREFRPGDHVVWWQAPGSYAEAVSVPAANAVHIPDELTDEVAAAVLLQGMTAHYLATSTYPVAEGDTVVVHAAAGGVGLLLTQIVKLRGGRVIATTSTPEKAELARQAGADEVIGYDGFSDRVRELTGGPGVPAVYDGIGRSTFEEGLKSLRPRGYLVVYGSASGQPPPVELARLNEGSFFLTRPTLHHYTATRQELLERASEVFGWVADGRLRVRIGARYPLEDARRAHEDLEARRTTGKLLLLPRSPIPPRPPSLP
ncbi:MAG TPA: quinone oxidoreductase [Actinomycetota bacterium]